MAVNILGPGASEGIGETTTRPEHVPTEKPVDTWFQDCSAPDADDGTLVEAQWLNMIMAQIRRAIRGMGVAEDESDDDMLLKAIQAAIASPTVFKTLTAGVGLSGGGNLSADTTIDMNIPELNELGAADPAADFLPIYDASGQVHAKVKPQNLGIGGDGGGGGSAINAQHGNWGGGTSVSVGSGNNGKSYGAFAVGQSTGGSEILIGSGAGTITDGFAQITIVGSGDVLNGRYVVIMAG